MIAPNGARAGNDAATPPPSASASLSVSISVPSTRVPGYRTGEGVAGGKWMGGAEPVRGSGGSPAAMLR